MDQKKILWIVAAAGVFLLVVFGAAAILYSPAAEPARTIVTSAPNASSQTSGWVAPATQSQPPAPPSYQQNAIAQGNDTTTGELPPTETVPTEQTQPSTVQPSGMITQVGDMTVISQNTTVYGLPQHQYTQADQPTTIDLGTTQKPAAQTSTNVTATNKAGATAIAAAQNNTTATQTEKPKTSTASTPKAATTTAPKTAAASVRASETKTATTQYWVQAAAFTSKKSADNAVVILDDNKIPANIFTYQDPKGTLYYRIRVGPYVTKSEAEYWQTRIAKIDTFASTNSYVTTTTSKQ